MVSMGSMPSHRANHNRSQDADSSGFDDPAEWSIASYCPDPLAGLDEPVPEVPNDYREASLNLLRLLLVVDAFVSRSRDVRLSYVTCALVLQLHSVRHLSQAEICRQMGISESTLSRSVSRFRSIAGLDSPDGLRAFGLLRTNGYHNNTA
jgi:hypothetical protein